MAVFKDDNWAIKGKAAGLFWNSIKVATTCSRFYCATDFYERLSHIRTWLAGVTRGFWLINLYCLTGNIVSMVTGLDLKCTIS